MKNRELLDKAYEAMENAYVPYSHFKVGAALLTESGKVYTGCNIESASYGATNCAERTAIFKAVSEGEKDFDKIAIVSHTHSETYPCGICRQVMAEFSEHLDLEVILDDGAGGEKVFTIDELLPGAFTKKDME